MASLVAVLVALLGSTSPPTERPLPTPMLPDAPAHAAWITERLETVYKQDPRYSDKAQSLFQLDLGPPEVSASSSSKQQEQRRGGLVKCHLSLCYASHTVAAPCCLCLGRSLASLPLAFCAREALDTPAHEGACIWGWGGFR